MRQRFDNYLRKEISSQLFALVLAIFMTALAVVAFQFRANIVYFGVSVALFPFALLMLYHYMPGYFGAIQTKKKLEILPDDKIPGLLQFELDKIDKELIHYQRRNMVFSGMLLFSFVSIGICFFTNEDSFLMGISIGFCAMAALQLSLHLFASFRRKLFQHEVRKYL